MNIKVAIGEVAKKLGALKAALYVSNKLGFVSRFYDEDANGVDLFKDIKRDGTLSEIVTVFDVGASLGAMTKLYLEGFERAKIFAFEPYLPSFKKLIGVYGDHPKVKLENLALSEKPGKAIMFLQHDSGYNSINEMVNRPDPEMKGQSQEVIVDTVDTYCERHGIKAIDFFKCDTEGLDIQVLKGAEGLLRQGKIRYVFVECTFESDNVQNTQFQQLHEYLGPFGYKTRGFYDQSNLGNKKYLTCVNALFALQ